jgi:hypothetical protein
MPVTPGQRGAAGILDGAAEADQPGQSGCSFSGRLRKDRLDQRQTKGDELKYSVAFHGTANRPYQTRDCLDAMRGGPCACQRCKSQSSREPFPFAQERLRRTQPSTQYTVILYFAATWFTSPTSNGGVGSRVFDVYCNGTTLLKNFDILREAGGVANRAVMRAFHHIPASLDFNARSFFSLSVGHLAYRPVRSLSSVPSIMKLLPSRAWPFTSVCNELDALKNCECCSWTGATPGARFKRLWKFRFALVKGTLASTVLPIASPVSAVSVWRMGGAPVTSTVSLILPGLN